MKEEYINNELWILTVGAGFQRSNVYPKEFPEEIKKNFRTFLKQLISKYSNLYANKQISEKKHIGNIKAIVGSVIHEYEINLNFGIAQKLLNLNLKYQWCLGKLKHDPPHFPVDRLIQELLNTEAKELNIKTQEVKAWTRFKDEAEYLRVIHFAEKVRSLSTKYKTMSLPEMELDIYNRR